MLRSMNLRERFEAKVSPDSATGCHLWKASVDGKGYGFFAVATKKIQRAHRVAWELAHGPVPVGMHVLHRCDVPGCVSIHHLFLGSNLDNVHDKMAKGRDPNKRKTHCAKGHPFSGENLYVHKDGHRECKTCNRVAALARYHVRRA